MFQFTVSLQISPQDPTPDAPLELDQRVVLDIIVLQIYKTDSSKAPRHMHLMWFRHVQPISLRVGFGQESIQDASDWQGDL